MRASTRCGSADWESWSGRVDTPGVMIRSSRRVGSSKRASIHWPRPDYDTPGPHQGRRPGGYWSPAMGIAHRVQ